MATPSNEPHPASQPQVIRLVRPSIIVLCGPAACGKTTFAERRFRPTQIISSDWARGRVCDDERDQRFQAQAFALVHFLIEQRLGSNRLCVVDSTALTPQARKDLLNLARRFQVPCSVFLFHVPLEKCVERDASRERTVGRSVIERQYQLFEQAKAGLRQEGFDQIYEFRDEDLDKVEIEVVFRPVARPAPAPGRPAAERARREPRAASPAPPAQPPAQGPVPGARPGGAPAAAPPREGVIRDLRPAAAGVKPASAPAAQPVPPPAAPAPEQPVRPSPPAAPASTETAGGDSGAAGTPAAPPRTETPPPGHGEPPGKTEP